MKIKLFILWLVFACLWLTSFSSAIHFDTNNLPLGQWVSFTLNDTWYIVLSNPTWNILYCDTNWGSCSIWIRDINTNSYVSQFVVSTNNVLSFENSVIPAWEYEIKAKYWSSYSVDFDILTFWSSDCPTCPSVPSLSCSNTWSISEILDDLILYSWSVNLNSSSYTNIFNYGNNGAGTYCVKLTSSSPQTLTFGFANGSTTAPTNLYTLYNDQYSNYVCLYGNKAYFNAKLNSSSNTVNYEVYRLTDLYSHDICIEDSQECPSCQDCSLLSWDLATCQGSLWACIEDNTSLENMNSSLQDQLSQCLANGGTSCDPEEDEDCYTWAYQLFHVFRQNQGSDFSLPISNNIFLPNWLRAYTDSWVVALAPLSPNDYSLDRESWEILNDLVIKIFYYLAVLLSVMALAYYIKKFLSFTLFPKKD